MQKNSKSTLNTTAASLLGFLHEQPMTGWDLLHTVRNRIGNFWSLTPSQVYREITVLIADGYITANDRGVRNKRLLSLTSKGREAFGLWIAQPPTEEIIRFPLLLSTFFSDHIEPKQLNEYIRLHEEAHRSRLKKYQQEYKALVESDEQAKRGRLLALSFGIKYEKAALEWMKDAISGE